MRGRRERQLRVGAQALLDVADGRRHGEQQQAAGARLHRRALRLGRLERADRDAVALVDEGWVGPHGLARAGQRDRPRQRADRPGAEALALNACGGRGELGPQAGSQLLAQRVEVGALGQRGSVLVLDAEGHAQVSRQAPDIPVLARDAHAAQPLELAAERVEQRLAARFEALDDLGGHVGHRHQPPARVLGQ